jgi:hypothetical protein
MITSCVSLYDARLPLWMRVPFVLFGLAILWLGFALAAYKFLGVGLGFSFENSEGYALLSSLACLAIAAIWLFAGFAHVRIAFDAARRELVVHSRFYFRWNERRISLVDCRELQLREFRGSKASRKWELSLTYADGRQEHVIDMGAGQEAFAADFSAATGLPARLLPLAA